MSIAQVTRRVFVTDSSRAAAAVGLAHCLPWLVALAGCAREDDQFARLTPTEARAMRALAAQLIPSDDGGPGAEDAGAVHFVDRALARPFFADSAPVIHAGLADLDARARALDGGGGFASLSSTQQMAVMRQIERDPFFTAARTLVVIGTFASPSHGGNRNGAGWALIGMEHRPTYTAPFGWYDAPLGTAPTTGAA